MVAKRPEWFFDEAGDMPEEVELHFVRPPEFAHLSQEEWADKLRAVAEEERKAAEERQRTGQRILGRKAVLRQSPYSSPKSFKALTMRGPKRTFRYLLTFKLLKIIIVFEYY